MNERLVKEVEEILSGQPVVETQEPVKPQEPQLPSPEELIKWKREAGIKYLGQQE